MAITKSKKVIVSLMIATYIASSFGSTINGLSQSIGNDDLASNISIEQTEEKSSMLSSLFGIQTASADYSDVYTKLKDIKGTTFENVIVKAYNLNIIKGYSDRTFRPNNGISFVETLAVVYKTLDKKAVASEYDNGSSNWADKYKAMYNAEDYTSLRTYGDNQLVNRDFALYLMLRNIGIEFNQSDYDKFSHNFSDLNSNSKFAPYIAFAYENGVTVGNNGKFGVNSTITRGEITSFAFKVLNMKSQLQNAYKNSTGRTASIVYTKTAIVENQSSNISSGGDTIVNNNTTNTTVSDINTKNIKVKINGTYQNLSKSDIFKIIQNQDPLAVKYLGLTPEKIGEGPYKNQISGDKFSEISLSNIKSGISGITDKSYVPVSTGIRTLGGKLLKKDENRKDFSQLILGTSIFNSFFGNIDYGSEKHTDLKNEIFKNGKIYFDGLGLDTSGYGKVKIGKTPGIDYSGVQDNMKMSGSDAYNWYKKAIEAEGLSNFFTFRYNPLDKEYQIFFTNGSGIRETYGFLENSTYTMFSLNPSKLSEENLTDNLGGILSYFTTRY